jgi:3-methyladenine DNA glycosylase/8-oxoguanine DNA glycosylase
VGGACHDEVVDGERRTVRTTVPVDLRRTLSPLRRGHRDPAFQPTLDGALWRATRLATGPATVRLQQTGPAEVRVDAWGPGAAQALAEAPALLGELDDVSTFDPPPGPVRDAYRRSASVRLARTGCLLEALVPAILEQRVITRTAHEAWRWLLVHHGEPAPGPVPAGMRVPPSAAGWAAVPSWDYHRAGVDPRRARAVQAAARCADRLEAAVPAGAAETTRRLLLVPGIGPWTAAETTQRALGDADAVSVGDYHLAGQVGWALTGRKVDDAGMLQLLAPYRPHRYRVVRHLLVAGLARVPRRGPRLAVEDHRRR